MSKMDALRAMREAKYDAARSRAATPTARLTRPATAAATPAAKPAARKAAKAVTAAEPSTHAEELCGHKNMGGKTCTRERGHAAKSHRYS
jgi:pyruvate/2-oxoglutarate dehydrogenase complex dihydrolipoamide acyltransferase (E2) component